ncbi:MAG TPA: hypothetical protein VLH84_04680 [Patescibacteria group bacterium]|nr:hypothetical protein [Patescibacteria group bacterium]
MPTIHQAFEGLDPVGYSEHGAPVYCAIPPEGRDGAVLHGTSYAVLLGCAMLGQGLRDAQLPRKKYLTLDFGAAVTEAGRVCDINQDRVRPCGRMWWVGIVPARIGLVIGFDSSRVPDGRVPGMEPDDSYYGGYEPRPGHAYRSNGAIWLTDIDPRTRELLPDLFRSDAPLLYNHRPVTGPVVGAVIDRTP